MENVVLTIHLLLALALVGVVLLQRSEGGGLGMGSGGGGGGVSSRPGLSGLGKMTWGLAVAFIATSLVLTILAARNATDGSVLDRVMDSAPAGQEAPAELPQGDDLLPPSTGEAPTDAPAQPPRAD